MGKSPGKWIKGLFGKKSTKSNLPKGKEVLVPVTEPTVDRSLVSQPTASVEASNVVDAVRGVAAMSYNEEVRDNTQTVPNSNREEDSEKLRQEEAVTKTQAAIRDYQARCEFQGLIRLQALIRGHLVRRQAVVTFHCVRGIVKLQAVARGRKVRNSDIGIEVQKSSDMGKSLGANSSGTNAPGCMEKLSNNAFICKLLASPNTLPLHIQYDSGNPNSDWKWLERWTRWRLTVQPKLDVIKPKKQVVSKSQAKRGGLQTKEKPKKSIRKPSIANSENGMTRSLDFEKPKRNPRTVPSHLADPIPERSQNETEKVKRGIRKISDSMNVVVPVSKSSEGDEILILPPVADDPVEEIFDNPAPAMQPVENKADSETPGRTIKEFDSKKEPAVNGNHTTSQRRASLPAKIDQPEIGTPKRPSYMAPTESAKARLRGQGSPRFADDVIVEKNEITRRHSLPNGKLSSMSPRIPKLVQAAGKGSVRTDRSFSSSRDGFERAEWKR